MIHIKFTACLNPRKIFTMFFESTEIMTSNLPMYTSYGFGFPLKSWILRFITWLYQVLCPSPLLLQNQSMYDQLNEIFSWYNSFIIIEFRYFRKNKWKGIQIYYKDRSREVAFLRNIWRRLSRENWILLYLRDRAIIMSYGILLTHQSRFGAITFLNTS